LLPLSYSSYGSQRTMEGLPRIYELRFKGHSDRNELTTSAATTGIFKGLVRTILGADGGGGSWRGNGQPGGGGGGGPTVFFFSIGGGSSSIRLISLSDELSSSLEESFFGRLFVDRPVGGLIPTKSAVLVIRSWHATILLMSIGRFDLNS
jgi:hypothetical protein